MVEQKHIFSIIFFGLPGIGKTSLATVICKELKINFGYFNPTIHKKQDLSKLLDDNLKIDEKFIIIIDEIHRMNKDKQDILLSYLEGTNLFIIGTTTENPYFTVNPAIRSRCQLFELKPISNIEMISAIEKIVNDKKINITNKQIEMIVENSGEIGRAHV